jgi:hypothetical protein
MSKGSNWAILRIEAFERLTEGPGDRLAFLRGVLVALQESVEMERGAVAEVLEHFEKRGAP